MPYAKSINKTKKRRNLHAKANCWEFKKCDRQPGGRLAGEHGVCPAATNDLVDGIPGGRTPAALWGGGRHVLRGAVQGTEAQKKHKCRKMRFSSARQKGGDVVARRFFGIDPGENDGHKKGIVKPNVSLPRLLTYSTMNVTTFCTICAPKQ